MWQGGLRLDMRKIFIIKRIVKPWNRLPKETVVIIHRDIQKLCICGGTFSGGLGSTGLTIGLDLEGLFQPKLIP